MKSLSDEQQRIVEDNMNLVYYIIRKHYPTFVGDEDIIQSGMLGLCKSVLNWDESKSSFSTYAGYCIRSAIAAELSSRNKHAGNISLDKPINDDEDLVLGDTISDKEHKHIDYSFLQNLTDAERWVFDLRTRDYSVEEIMNLTGFDRRKVARVIRTARAKFRKVN